MTLKRGIWICSILTLVLCGIGIMVYHSMFINLFGFHINKNQIHRVIVYGPDANHAYDIQNPKLIEEIYTDAASLQRSHKMGVTNFPQYKVYSPIPKFLVQTTDDATYGGTLWANGQLMDANGYYWATTPQLMNVLSQSIHDKQTKELY